MRKLIVYVFVLVLTMVGSEAAVVLSPVRSGGNIAYEVFMAGVLEIGEVGSFGSASDASGEGSSFFQQEGVEDVQSVGLRLNWSTITTGKTSHIDGTEGMVLRLNGNAFLGSPEIDFSDVGSVYGGVEVGWWGLRRFEILKSKGGVYRLGVFSRDEVLR